MECIEARKLIPLASGGDVAEEEQEALSTHIEDCAACRRLWQKYLADREAIKSLCSLPLPEETEKRLLNFFDTLLKRRKKTPSPVMRIVHILTAVALILITFSILFISILEEEKKEDKPTQPKTVFERIEYHRTLRRAYENASVDGKMKAMPAEREKCRLLDSADTSPFDF